MKDNSIKNVHDILDRHKVKTVGYLIIQADCSVKKLFSLTVEFVNI